MNTTVFVILLTCNIHCNNVFTKSAWTLMPIIFNYLLLYSGKFSRFSKADS